MTLPKILYDNILIDATLSCTPDAADDYDVNNIIDLRPYTQMLFSAAGTAYITIDCLTLKTASALSIVGHNLHTASAACVIQKSVNGVDWIDVDDFEPSDDNALFFEFDSTESRYWRLKITTAAVAAQIGVFILGVPITFEYPADAPYDLQPEQIEAESARSKAGHLLGAVIRFKRLDVFASFSNFTKTWLDAYFLPFWNNHASDLKPFIFYYNSKVLFVSIAEGSGLNLPQRTSAHIQNLTLRMTSIKE